MSFVALVVLVPAAIGVAAEPLPSYDGAMTFQSIPDPDGPEEYSWEVNLGEGQDLRQVDGRNAAVYYTESEHLAFSIQAIEAHDAIGTTVPTSLTVTQPNIITLTVHHRSGNPAVGGASFDYPVNAGSGWEGGIQAHLIEGPPSVVPSGSLYVQAPAPSCFVPDVVGLTLKASRRQLRRSNCNLGEVRGERLRGARVVRQFRKAGRSLPVGTQVGVKLLVPEPRAPQREQSHR
ncbi:MAG TPA: hypothetical protein VIT89_12195 [Solirubrobacterales bacterium]